MTIIHKAIYHETRLIMANSFSVIRKKLVYLCNQAVKPNKNKYNLQWSKVTCENCLKQKPNLYETPNLYLFSKIMNEMFDNNQNINHPKDLDLTEIYSMLYTWKFGLR